MKIKIGEYRVHLGRWWKLSLLAHPM